MSASSIAQPEVLFYLLNSTDPQSFERFCCQLVNKIYQQSRRCDLRFADLHQAQRFDLTLWNWQNTAFIPHALEQAQPAPIQLYPQSIPHPCQDVLINLHPEFYPAFSSYQRTIEILDQSDYLVQKGRQRWKAYQQNDITPLLHKIGFSN
ncbi:MAG: DNA polymerase III subunit chi [Thiotrichales bacterium]|nr:DNA polymerase III subunit chi [Thiotrichales bacterium]